MTSGKAPSRGAENRLRTGAALLTFWQLIRVGLQALWMLVIARTLGASGYGLLAGYTGLASAMGAFTGLGFGLTMLQEASRDHSRFGTTLRHASGATVISGTGLWLLFTVAGNALLGHGLPTFAIACVGIAELLAFPTAILSSYAYQAHDRPGMAGMMYAVIPASNLLAVAAFLVCGSDRSLTGYVPYHAGFACIGATGAWIVMRCHLTPGKAQAPLPTRSEIKESAGFSLMRVVDTAMVALDKSLVLRLAGPEVAGYYTVAFRLASVLAIPVSALAMAALPRLFRARKPAETTRLATSLLSASAVFGILAAIGMLASASLLPWLLGASFADTAHAARMLCATPLLLGLAATGANVLVTSQRRLLRTAAQATGLAVLYGLGVLLVPRDGIEGAAAMLQGALAVTALLLWLAIFFRPPSSTYRTEIESQ
jgi:O-antigen/teichoic acid export membrane protein